MDVAVIQAWSCSVIQAGIWPRTPRYLTGMRGGKARAIWDAIISQLLAEADYKQHDPAERVTGIELLRRQRGNRIVFGPITKLGGPLSIYKSSFDHLTVRPGIEHLEHRRAPTVWFGVLRVIA